MGKVFRSWFFFTALLLFLLAASVSLPKLKDRLFGETEARISESVDNMEGQVRAVWAQLMP